MKKFVLYSLTVFLLNSPFAFAEKTALEKDTQQFIDSLNSKNSKPIYTLTPSEARDFLTNVQSVAVKLAPADLEEKTIEVDGKKILLNIIRPKNVNKLLPVVMYFHGGGWVLGDFKTHERFLRELANYANAAIVFVNYSRAPESKYPVQIEEAYGATKWIAENGKSLNLDPTKIAVAGDSVGANMAIVITLLAKEKKIPNIVFQLLYYPVTNANLNTETYKLFENGPWLTKKAMEWFWNAYLPNKQDPMKITISPVQASIKELEGLPPALIITAQDDVLRGEGEAYAYKLMQAGVLVIATRYLGTIHDFVMLNPLANTPASRAATYHGGHSLWWFLNKDNNKKPENN